MGTIWQPRLAEGTGPKYKLVAQAIREGIDAGELAVGDKLPPVRELAWQMGITPGTVARAYTILTDGGHLRAEVGRGTFVAPKQALPRTDPCLPDRPDRGQYLEVADSDVVTLFSPHLPDMGQIALIREAQRLNPHAPWTNRMLASAASYMGDHETARAAGRALLAAYPKITIAYLRDCLPRSSITYEPRYFDALRAVGVPEA